MKKSRGFTLIEMMITVAIVGILSAVALPAYQDYTIKAQVSESLVMVGGIKYQILNHYTETGRFPADNSAIDFAGASGKFVSSVTVNNGAITVAFSSTTPQEANTVLNGQTLTYTPIPHSTTGNLIWTCSATVDQRYLPSICK